MRDNAIMERGSYTININKLYNFKPYIFALSRKQKTGKRSLHNAGVGSSSLPVATIYQRVHSDVSPFLLPGSSTLSLQNSNKQSLSGWVSTGMATGRLFEPRSIYKLPL